MLPEAHELKYLSVMFEAGSLTYPSLAPALADSGRWEMVIHSKNGGLFVETAKGEQRVFNTLDGAKAFAEKIGFRRMEINW